MLHPVAPDRIALGINGSHGHNALVFSVDSYGEPHAVMPCTAAEMRVTTRGWTTLRLEWGDGSEADYTAIDLKVEGVFHRNRVIEERT